LDQIVKLYEVVPIPVFTGNYGTLIKKMESPFEGGGSIFDCAQRIVFSSAYQPDRILFIGERTTDNQI